MNPQLFLDNIDALKEDVYNTFDEDGEFADTYCIAEVDKLIEEYDKVIEHLRSLIK